MDLREYIRTHKPKGFNPVPYFSKEGNFLTYYFKDDRCYAKRINDALTVYLKFDTDELVGFKVDGIKEFLQAAGVGRK